MFSNAAGPRGALLAVLVFALVSFSVANAQTVRRGVRVQVTSIEGGGGWSGTAFVSVPPSRLTVTSAGGCGVTIVGEGRATSGRFRTLHIELRGAAGDAIELPLGVSGCPGASLVLGLEDGSTIVADSGTVHTSLRTSGEATGTFTATSTSAGVPLAIAGEIALAPRTP